MLIAQAPTPEIPKLPADTPGWVYAVVYAAVAVIAVIAYAGRLIGTKKADPPASPPVPAAGPVPAADPAPATGMVREQAYDAAQLVDRLVAKLEERLDAALATQHDIQRRYDDEVDELRAQLAAKDAQLSAKDQQNWQLSAQMQELHRQLEAARTEVIQLRAELSATRPAPPGRPW